MAIMFSAISSDVIAFLVIFFGVIYGYVKYVYTYWDRRGVKHLKPKFPLGNFEDFYMQRVSIGELVQKMYSQTTEPFIGIYDAIRPTCTRSSSYTSNIHNRLSVFGDRGVYLNEANDPLSSTLLAMEGEKWKNLRAKLTPLFTSGKLKAMYSTLLDCSVPLKQYLNKEAENGNVVNMREIAVRYTTDIIGSTIFGVEVNTINNPDAPFRNFGRKVNMFTVKITCWPITLRQICVTSLKTVRFLRNKHEKR